jgi:histidine triad (HIT) family protein
MLQLVQGKGRRKDDACMASCIFCDIIRGEAAASSVFRNDLVSAFLDISPVTPGHTLVVPNAHAELLRDMPPDVRYELFHIALEVGEALRRSGLRVEGLNFFVAISTSCLGTQAMALL